MSKKSKKQAAEAVAQALADEASASVDPSSEEVEARKNVRTELRSSPSAAQLIICSLAAFLLLVVTIAGKYALDHIIFPEDSTYKVNEWMFFWGKTDKDISGDLSVMYNATALNPIRHTVGTDYLRVRYNIEPSEEERLLSVNTESFPLKIILNDEEIYNNGYGKIEYTGESLSKVNIPISSNEQTLEIYMFVPFSFSFDTTLTPVSKSNTNHFFSSENLREYIGIFFGAIVIALGLMLVVISLLLSFKNKFLGKLIILGISVSFCGISLILNQFEFIPGLSASPVWLNISVFVDFLVTICVFINVILCYNRWKPATIIMMILALGVAACVTLVETRFLFVLDYVAFAVLQIILTILLATSFYGIVGKKLPYSRLCLTIFLYITFTNVCKAVTFVFGLTGFSNYFDVVGLLLFCFVTFIVFYNQSIFLSVKKPERDLQIEHDAQWISKITSTVSNVFVQKTDKDFFIKAAEGLCDLIRSNAYTDAIDDYPFNASYDLPTQDIRACVGMAEKGGFTEIFNLGKIENCNYAIIASKYSYASKECIFFANSFLDILFVDENGVAAVLHFENISDGLSAHFKNMVTTMFTNMRTAFLNMRLKDNMAMTQENVFIALAETVEMKNVGTTRHMKVVSEITGVLCKQMGFTPYDSRLISSAAMVHDIGKIAIPEHLLEKNGKLEPDEMRIMKQHIIFGYNILSQSPGEFMNAAAIIAQQHHEAFDGSGYIGLSGDEIHVYARISAVADVFDALAAKRSYKEPWPISRVMDFMNDNSGKKFDPKIISALNRCIGEISEIENRYNIENANK